MTTERIDHAATALRTLGQIRGVDEATNQVTLAIEAQVHATLALVEQQRIANTIAISQISNGDSRPPLMHIAVEAADEYRIQPVADIREGLGL